MVPAYVLVTDLPRLDLDDRISEFGGDDDNDDEHVVLSSARGRRRWRWRWRWRCRWVPKLVGDRGAVSSEKVEETVYLEKVEGREGGVSGGGRRNKTKNHGRRCAQGEV